MGRHLHLLVCSALAYSGWCARPETVRRQAEDDSEPSLSSGFVQSVVSETGTEVDPPEIGEIGEALVNTTVLVPDVSADSGTPPAKLWTYSFIGDMGSPCNRGQSPKGPMRCSRVLRKFIGDKTDYTMDVITRTDPRTSEFPPGCSLQGTTMYFNKKMSSTATRNDVRMVCSVTLLKDAKEIGKKVNAERESERESNPEIKNVCVSMRATTASIKHSADMVKRDYFSHTAPAPAPNGANPGDRLGSEGFLYSWWGENIAYGQDENDLSNVHLAWMRSQGHKDNILRPQFTHMGFAYFFDSAGRPYYTQKFARGPVSECDWTQS